MFCRKNYYLYRSSGEGKKQLAGSVRMTVRDQQWNLEINWKECPPITEDQESCFMTVDQQDVILSFKPQPQMQPQPQLQPEKEETEMIHPWASVREKCHRCHNRIGEWELYHVRYEELSILPEEVKGTMNNSFLIHGLMNYKYIAILFSVRTPSKTAIGVPGVYHQREEEVATMFGFTEFAGEKGCEIGSYGYYLRFL